MSIQPYEKLFFFSFYFLFRKYYNDTIPTYAKKLFAIFYIKSRLLNIIGH